MSRAIASKRAIRATRALRRGWFVGVAFLALAGASRGQQAGELQFTAIGVGFGDAYKVGHWTPVELTIRGGQEPVTGFFTLTVPDGDGTLSTVMSDRPYQVLPGQPTRAVLYARPGRSDCEFRARFVRSEAEGGDELARATFSTHFEADREHPREALLASQELFVGFGSSIGVEAALQDRNVNAFPQYEAKYSRIADAARLPSRWYGYEGVDCLVLSGSQPELYGALGENSAQLAALKQWVRLGGRVVLAVGRQANEIIGPGGPLADLAPGRFVGLKGVRPNRAFEAYISASEPLPESRRGGNDGRLQVPQLADVRGKIEVQESADVPLVVRAPYGFGEVLFVAVDLDEPPFARWSQRGRLMGRLLRFSEGDQPNPGRQQLGYNDLSGQLRAGLDEFTGIKIAPFWLVAVLIMAYIACIGPLDYLLVKKVFKRMEFTWFTFPAIVLVVSVGAYYLAYWMKGEALLVNQVDVVDSDLTESPAAPRMRGVTWLNVFSPQMQSYDVTVAPAIAGRQLPGVERLVSWMGLPGTGFGGMNQMTADPPLFSRAYAYAPDLSRMIDVPIQVWSTKSFTARWHSAQGSPAGIEADLKAGAGDAIDGKLANRLPVPLADCLLAYGSAAYRIGDLKPGQEFTVEQLSRRRLADELKTRRTAAVAGSAIGWNAGSRDVPTIVEQMMFYQAAGGFAVTQLDNRYQRFIDFSNHLAMGQAILVGRAAQSAAPLQLADRPVENEHNKQWTIYRFLLPVKKR